MSKLPISVTMLVKNAEKYLAQSLQSLSDFDEIIVLDNGSTDNSLMIAKRFNNVKIFQHPFIGFGPMKNLAASFARYDWVMNIDSDEILSPELVVEIRQLDFTDCNKVYAMLRINHYRGKAIKVCGWYPDYVKRLYHRHTVKFNDKQVHESLQIEHNIEIKKLTHAFKHYSFDGAESLINKMQHYSSLFAQQQQFMRSSSLAKAIAHLSSSFIKHYFIKRGFVAGRDGFVISFANASGSYYKYIKLAEANQKLTTALIITTYNRPDALRAVLQSILIQSHLPTEVIIADDGSTAETAAVISDFEKICPIPVKHAWQPDKGFRLAMSRNRAIALARSDYLIMIDGDIVMHRNFIADHCRVARKKRLVQGGRLLLTEQKTTELLKDPTSYHQLKWYEKGLEKRWEKRLSALRIPLLSQIILMKERTNWHNGIRGCNIACFREDALAINGFNNEFIGWGREDSEFVARFFHYGGKRVNLKFAAISYHLWHNEAPRLPLPQNEKLLFEAMKHKWVRCQNGIAELMPE